MNSTRRIIVDLIPDRDNGPALARARELAAANESAVDLFVCDYLQWLSGDLIFTAENVDGAREAYFSELASWARQLGEPLKADGIEVSVHTVWHTPRYEALLEHANEVGADWIMRVASRHGTLARLLLSATDWELIRHANQRLWFVKSADARPDRLRILAAVDPTHPQDPGMDRDKRVLDTAQSLCDDLGAELHVFHAWMPPAAAPPGPASAIVADAAAAPIPSIDEKTLKAARERHRDCLDSLLAEYDVPAERVHMAEGKPADVIEDIVDEHGIGTVVAGAASRSWLQRLLIGSTAETLFGAVGCDLVVVKEDESSDDD